jgi:SAM-dependent methyltransferase
MYERSPKLTLQNHKTVPVPGSTAMHREFLESIHCPFTGSPFELVTVSRGVGSAIDLGVVASGAGEFPIIAGVLRLISDDLREPLTRLAKKDRLGEALATSMEIPAGYTKWGALYNRLWRISHRRNLGPATKVLSLSKRRLQRLLSDPDITFGELALGIGGKSWRNWQTYRFSMPAFQVNFALAHLAKGCQSLLDFGSGMGHAAFVLSRIANPDLVVCADYSFTALYFAKKFLVPNAQCICLDGNYPLPFGKGDFDCVFSADALQYIESKLGLAREFQRILSARGKIVLGHLHDRLSSPQFDKALTARGYDGLFTGMVRRLYPEDQLVAEYVTKDILNLERQWSLEELKDVDLSGLSLVAANSELPFRRYTGLLENYINSMDRPQFNPAYNLVERHGTVVLGNAIGAPYVVERKIEDFVLLPKTWTINGSFPGPSGLPENLQHLTKEQLRELARRLLVLDLPEGWLARKENDV